MIRCVYENARPTFPPSDQHPDAKRYGPLTLSNGLVVYVDAIGSQPSLAEVEAFLNITPAAPSTAAAQLDQHLATSIAEFSPAKEPTMSDTDQSAAASAPAANSNSATVSSPGAHAMTIKQVLEDHGKKLERVLQTQLALLATELDGQLTTVVNGTEAVITKVRSHTDDFKSILGQFTNLG